MVGDGLFEESGRLPDLHLRAELHHLLLVWAFVYVTAVFSDFTVMCLSMLYSYTAYTVSVLGLALIKYTHTSDCTHPFRAFQ